MTSFDFDLSNFVQALVEFSSTSINLRILDFFFFYGTFLFAMDLIECLPQHAKFSTKTIFHFPVNCWESPVFADKATSVFLSFPVPKDAYVVTVTLVTKATNQGDKTNPFWTWLCVRTENASRDCV